MPFLPDAVESILHQSFTDFTFIIVNDGSTDKSKDYLSALQDPRIVVIHQANAGQGAARNVALRRCKSEYAALMDADDISKPDRLREQMEYLDSHPDTVMVGTQIEFLIGNVAQRALGIPVDHDEIEARLLKGRAGLCNPSLMFRTAPALDCLDYPAGLVGEDIDFGLQMCERGRVANLDRVLFQYRLQSGQSSMTKSKAAVRMSCYAAYRASFRRNGLPSPSVEEFIRSSSLVSRWQWSFGAWELIQYRKGRIQMASGHPLSGALRLALLGLCRPFAAINHISRSIGTARKRRAERAKSDSFVRC
jgi:glycosyltransferase involved in cell wall biosynthesis